MLLKHTQKLRSTKIMYDYHDEREQLIMETVANETIEDLNRRLELLSRGIKADEEDKAAFAPDGPYDRIITDWKEKTGSSIDPQWDALTQLQNCLSNPFTCPMAAEALLEAEQEVLGTDEE